jgi:hypothetical protein
VERREERKRGLSLVLAVCGAVTIPIGYVLSYPLALRLALASGFQHEFKLFYAPLRWLLYHCRPLNDLMNWYSSLWG